MIEEKKRVDDAVPSSFNDKHGVYLKKQKGEWVKYEYKDVRGIIEPDGKYKAIFGGKEYHLVDGINYPKKEWKEFIYTEILYSRDLDLYKKAYLRQLKNRELTNALKHFLLLFEEKDDETIEVKVNKKIIMHCLEYRMQGLYLYDDFWKRWYNLHLHNDGSRIPFKLAIYGLEFDIMIDKNRFDEYSNAAQIVTNRLNAYTFAYKDRKTKHQIALMTMIDIAVSPFNIQSEEVEEEKKIELPVCDEILEATIFERDQELFERSAKLVTNCYYEYLGHYKGYKTEDAIERMTLLDLYFHPMEWKHKRFMDYLIST